MMKTKNNLLKTSLLLMVMVTFGVFQVQGQTAFSGNADPTTNNTLGAGTTGTNFGAGAGQSNNGTGAFNTAVGQYSLNQNINGENNTATGYNALRYGQMVNSGTILGNYNTANGSGALENNYASYNTALGARSLWINTKGTRNTACGYYSLNANDSGNYNTATGYKALVSNIIGFGNTTNGHEAGYYNTTGSLNTYIGYGTQRTNAPNASYSYSTAIGANAVVRNSYSMILGDNNINVGIGLSNVALGPRDKLEINSDDASPTTTQGGNSGLQFRDLTTASNPISNPGTGVLSVNPDGKVIYVTGASGIANARNGTSIVNVSGIGDYVELGLNPLIQDTDIPLNNHNLLFSYGNNPLSAINQIGVGAIAPNTKFTINNNSEPIGLQISTNTSSYSSKFGIYTTCTGGTSSNNGVYSLAFGNVSNNAIMGFGQNGSLFNNGVWGSGSGSSIKNTGVEGYAYGGTDNYGGYFQSTGAGPGTNYGVYGEAANGATDNWAAWFDGKTWCTNHIWEPSDSILKNNIHSITNSITSLNIINQLNPVTYTYKIADYPQMNFPSENQFGFIAQDVELILPDLVKGVTTPADYDSIGNILYPAIDINGINYQGFIPIIVQAIKELDTKNDSVAEGFNNELSNLKDQISDQNKKIDELEQMINECCSQNKSMLNNNGGLGNVETVLNVELANNIILYQNEPNPFGESTVIRYYLPENISGNAYMIFTDLYGKEIKKVELTERGFGKINADAQNLTGGAYTYSLIINGVVKDTKKMVKQ